MKFVDAQRPTELLHGPPEVVDLVQFLAASPHAIVGETLGPIQQAIPLHRREDFRYTHAIFMTPSRAGS
jgi:hypothetical protein